MKYQDILYRPRPVLHHRPMEVAHRAKQFAPFAALKGFESTVQKQEVRYRERPILSEDQKEALDQTLREMQAGDIVTVTWFAENVSTWRRRITERAGSTPDDSVRLYQNMQREEAQLPRLGLLQRRTGEVLWFEAGGELWLEGWDEDGKEYDVEIIPLEDLVELRYRIE